MELKSLISWMTVIRYRIIMNDMDHQSINHDVIIMTLSFSLRMPHLPLPQSL